MKNVATLNWTYHAKDYKIISNINDSTHFKK